MKLIAAIKNYQKEGLEEIQLSLLLHLALLMAMSAYLIWNQTLVKPERKNLVPVQLIAAVSQPRPGSNLETKEEIASQKAKGTVARAAAPKPQPIPQKAATPKVKSQPAPTPKPIAKPASKVEAKAVAKVETPAAKPEIVKAPATEVEKTPVIAETPAQTSEPVVVQEPVKQAAPIRPTHNNPTFESISRLSTEKSASSQLSPAISGMQMSSAMPAVSPEHFSSDDRISASPLDFMPLDPGTEQADNTDAAGNIQIGSIESFGGNAENFTAPTIIRRVLPEYPDWARKQGVRGSAVYRVLIQTSGTVGDVITMSSTIDPKLAINGAQSLRRWVFAPVLANGEPRETWVKIKVQYKLN